MSQQDLRPAPEGFAPEQWDAFMDDGFLVIEDAMSDDDVGRYRDAVDKLWRDGGNHPDKNLGAQNIVEKDPTFVDLIDHPRHVGYVYDVYGELLKMILSHALVRTRGAWHNAWHPDGARLVPYGVYTDQPMQIKIGLWLTDLPEPGMGNFVCLPGSHKSQTLDAYTTHESLVGEHILQCRAGTMTMMHGSIWHRVEDNETDIPRKNIFLSYSPSWVVAADRHTSDPDWLETVGREQRILMRSYTNGYTNHKPPSDDSPLFLDRDTGLDIDEGADEKVPVGIRKRKTTIEKFRERGLVRN
ncbi:hypothetical protein HN371_06390 [Candidatus Poribacteria bacterium]|jgi:hypothetical protein|nr:hypothetical protein [Candidatus Poribacteria bacterium]MBT5537116.1 hypothetical protein [Candidatus Poribacteria bacterium]MBT5715044.1 hypothetical protein [Candidatus Poribacteria bacterium]MBT7098201.1 hypothetical protein [Candidatus Poribacteria bacterium]MBT7806763.1 hypothetical protein [Candidatus Poribacteria bacterium]